MVGTLFFVLLFICVADKSWLRSLVVPPIFVEKADAATVVLFAVAAVMGYTVVVVSIVFVHVLC